MFAVARTAPTGTVTRFVNLDKATMIVSTVSGAKWYAKVFMDESECYVLSAAGYNSKALCDAAITTALTPIA